MKKECEIGFFHTSLMGYKPTRIHVKTQRKKRYWLYPQQPVDN